MNEDRECTVQQERDTLAAALKEIIDQKHYKGFGDAASRGAYVDSVAREALKVLEEQR